LEQETKFAIKKLGKKMAPSTQFSTIVSGCAVQNALNEEELIKAVALFKTLLNVPLAEFQLSPSNAELRLWSETTLVSLKQQISLGK
jgi:hypothetical protein